MQNEDQRGQLGLLQDTPGHSYVRPNQGGPFAPETTAQHTTGEITSGYDIKQAFRPGPAQPPEEYARYKDNAYIKNSVRDEHVIVGDEGPLVGEFAGLPAYHPGIELAMSNPAINAEQYNRPMHSPAPYRFMRSFGNFRERYFNGSHSSAAGMQENKQIQVALIGGLEATPNRRNSFRISPPSADVAQVNETVPIDIQQNVYPESQGYVTARGYRIG